MKGFENVYLLFCDQLAWYQEIVPIKSKIFITMVWIISNHKSTKVLYNYIVYVYILYLL